MCPPSGQWAWQGMLQLIGLVGDKDLPDEELLDRSATGATHTLARKTATAAAATAANDLILQRYQLSGRMIIMLNFALRCAAFKE